MYDFDKEREEVKRLINLKDTEWTVVELYKKHLYRLLQIQFDLERGLNDISSREIDAQEDILDLIWYSFDATSRQEANSWSADKCVQDILSSKSGEYSILRRPEDYTLEAKNDRA